MLSALGQSAYTLTVLLEVALGALFTMCGTVLVTVDHAPFLQGIGARLGAALAMVGLALFLLGARGFAGLAI